MRYELWDIDARFFLGRFASEGEALTFVLTVLDEEGDAYADNLELAIGEDGTRNVSGADLVKWARGLGTTDAEAEERQGLVVGGSSESGFAGSSKTIAAKPRR